MSRTRAVLSATLLATFAVACSTSETTPTSDAGGLDAEVPEDATVIVPAGDLAGRDTTTFVTESGEVTMPVDRSGTAIAAYVESARSWVKLPGVGLASGEVRVPDVPAGPVLLQIGAQYLVTRGRDLDLGAAVLGRPDGVPIMMSTLLELHLGGLAPWQATDGIEVVAVNVGDLVYDAQTSAARGWPEPGATQLDGLAVDLSAAEGGGVHLDAARGDRAIVAQLSTLTSTSVPIRVLTRAFTAEGLTTADGTGTLVSGTFTPVPATTSLHLEWRRSEFAALGASIHPSAAPTPASLFVEAQPAGATHGNFSATPDLVIASPPSGESDVSFGTVSFGDPYPPEWPLIYGAVHAWEVAYNLPGARRAVHLRATIFAQAAATDGGRPIRPVLSPVRDPRVNGASAWQSASGVGRTPELSWTAPELGTPSEYQLEVLHLRAEPIAQRTEADLVAFLRTKDTRIRVPPDVLEPGEPYVFSIIAWWDPASDLDVAPNRTGLAAAGATVLTALVRP